MGFGQGPRAHINFNDFFGGANVVSSNLVFNSCRETGGSTCCYFYVRLKAHITVCVICSRPRSIQQVRRYQIVIALAVQTRLSLQSPCCSWGRQVYITKVRDGVTASVTPAFTEIRNNFVISNYHGHEGKPANIVHFSCCDLKGSHIARRSNGGP